VRVWRFVFLTLLTLVASTMPAAVHAGAIAPATDAAPVDSPVSPEMPAGQPVTSDPTNTPADGPRPSEPKPPTAAFTAVIIADVWDGVSARTVHGGCPSLLLTDDDGRIGPDMPVWAVVRFFRVESERFRSDLRRAWCLSLFPHAPPTA